MIASIVKTYQAKALSEVLDYTCQYTYSSTLRSVLTHLQTTFALT